MKTYKETMEALHYTDAQKQRLARIVLDAAAAEKKPRRVPLRTALLAAGIAAALCVGAGATGALKTAVEAFGGFFGEETAQTEVIDRIDGSDGIVHAGDINKPEIVEQLKSIAPLYVVRGNNDME